MITPYSLSATLLSAYLPCFPCFRKVNDNYDHDILRLLPNDIDSHLAKELSALQAPKRLLRLVEREAAIDDGREDIFGGFS